VNHAQSTGELLILYCSQLLMPKVAFLLNTLKFLLWIIRHNELDTINLYNSITPYIQIATGGNGNMLNFGYWGHNKKTEYMNPMQAQEELSALIGKFGDFHLSHRIIDAGSGFSAPAAQWKSTYDFLDIVCVNINSQQLSTAAQALVPLIATTIGFNIINTNINNGNVSTADATKQPVTSELCGNIISLVNATATTLPFADECVDRVVALESAQHFKPLQHFFKESARILKPGGLLIIAMPVMIGSTDGKINWSPFIHQFRKLGILYFSWASEHYTLDSIESSLKSEGIKIEDIQHIGHYVYEPLANYYIQNRKLLKKTIKDNLSSYVQEMLFEIVENIIYRSALKMKNLSQKAIIDYVLIKCEKI
jgi:ubiquinone/menaquinone biosynthesis C-methylase UbiE